MKTLYRHRRSLVAVLQLVFLIQLAYGVCMLLLFTVDAESSLGGTIRDDVKIKVIKHIRRDNERSGLFIVFSASAGLLLSSLLASAVKKET